MVSKNSEAPLAATFGASIENNREGNIDMNSVQNKELSFHNVTLVPAPVADGIWLTSADIAKALGYASSKAFRPFTHAIQMSSQAACQWSSK